MATSTQQLSQRSTRRSTRHRCFLPWTPQERIALYRRVWGPSWDPALIGLADDFASGYIQ
jgi:hypothetical protein